MHLRLWLHLLLPALLVPGCGSVVEVGKLISQRLNIHLLPLLLRVLGWGNSLARWVNSLPWPPRLLLHLLLGRPPRLLLRLRPLLPLAVLLPRLLPHAPLFLCLTIPLFRWLRLHARRPAKAGEGHIPAGVGLVGNHPHWRRLRWLGRRAVACRQARVQAGKKAGACRSKLEL